jgi:hypothetical protein
MKIKTPIEFQGASKTFQKQKEPKKCVRTYKPQEHKKDHSIASLKTQRFSRTEKLRSETQYVCL